MNRLTLEEIAKMKSIELYREKIKDDHISFHYDRCKKYTLKELVTSRTEASPRDWYIQLLIYITIEYIESGRISKGDALEYLLIMGD